MMNTQQYADLWKNWFDMNQVFASQRRNMEAVSAANQVVVESAQALARRSAEVARENVETVLRSSKEMLTNGTPDINANRQAEIARTMFESALSNLREMSETVAKTGFEAFDVLNKRMVEITQETSKSAGAATSGKRKSAA